MEKGSGAARHFRIAGSQRWMVPKTLPNRPPARGAKARWSGAKVGATNRHSGAAPDFRRAKVLVFRIPNLISTDVRQLSNPKRFAVVRRGSPEYGSAPPGQSSVRRHTPKFALTAVIYEGRSRVKGQGHLDPGKGNE